MKARGVPVPATLAGTSVAVLAIIMSYLSRTTVFAFLAVLFFDHYAIDRLKTRVGRWLAYESYG